MNSSNESRKLGKCNLEWIKEYSSKEFEREFTYEGNLGAIYGGESTEFKLWSPYADGVKVNLYRNGDVNNKDEKDLIDTIPLVKGDKGVWSVKVDKDIDGVYYTYSITFDKKYEGAYDCEICDPYARACGVNGIRGMVVNLENTNPDGFSEDKNPNEELPVCESIIYELHVRDLSSDDSSGIIHKGKFLGLTEQGTTVNNEGAISTGISHIKELGVTHIHLLPFYDYATIDETAPFSHDQYNWGYDPLNYNIPEGSYATDAFDGRTRIIELKKTIKSLHDNGISVIMDVVYNHTYNDDFCFNKSVPGYFQRMDKNGIKSDGSACGNDTASERSMVSKYIVDSVLYWAREYHIDGFRFDLVGLIDVDTINKIRKGLDQIRPNIMMYGEGWTLDTKLTKEDVVLSTQNHINYLERFAMFSDDIRDAIKGSVFIEEEKGFISGNTEEVDILKGAVMGMPYWSDSPDKVINYTSCHDNYTLFDKIFLCNEDISFEDAVKQNLLAASIVMLSQGIPLLHAGEEMLRTKVNAQGEYVSDSVRDADSVNSIKWDTLKLQEYYHVYEYYKGLIEFRKNHRLFLLDCKEQVDKYMHYLDTAQEGVVAYELKNEQEDIIVVFNAMKKAYELDLLEQQEYHIYINDEKAGNRILQKVKKEVAVEPVSCMVLIKA